MPVPGRRVTKGSLAMRPLWRLLLDSGAGCTDAPTCEECQAIFTLLAELRGLSQGLEAAEDRRLLTAIRRHLDCCADCRAAIGQKLEALERLSDSGDGAPARAG